MKKDQVRIIGKSIVFISICFVLLYVVNYFYFKLIIPETITYRRNNFFQEHVSGIPNKNIDFIFFGSSHTANGINPKYIPNSYNLADSGMTYIEMYYELRKAIDYDKVKVENIILELDPHMFYRRFEDGKYLFRDFWYYSQFASINELRGINNSSFINLLVKSKFPVIGDSIKFGILISKPVQKEIYLGWQKSDGIIKYNKKDVEMIEERISGEQGMSELRFEYLKKTIELAKNNNINVFFIKNPHPKDYEELLFMNNFVYNDYYDDVFDKIDLLKGDNNYKVLDYYGVFHENDEYFTDLVHLNYKGAEIYSKKINEDIAKYRNNK